jgi:hypothetical protein
MYYISGHFPSPCPETGTSPVDWAQLSNFHLKTEIEYFVPKTFILNKRQTMDNVQKYSYILITLRYHRHKPTDIFQITISTHYQEASTQIWNNYGNGKWQWSDWLQAGCLGFNSDFEYLCRVQSLWPNQLLPRDTEGSFPEGNVYRLWRCLPHLGYERRISSRLCLNTGTVLHFLQWNKISDSANSSELHAKK